MHVYIHRASDSFQNAYVHRLETALGTPHFDTVLRELESDSRITHEELVQVAKEFLGSIAPSSSKNKIIQFIRSRHDKMMRFRSESERTGIGRRSAS